MMRHGILFDNHTQQPLTRSAQLRLVNVPAFLGRKNLPRVSHHSLGVSLADSAPLYLKVGVGGELNRLHRRQVL